jgi:hypothetical protein
LLGLLILIRTNSKHSSFRQGNYQITSTPSENQRRLDDPFLPLYRSPPPYPVTTHYTLHTSILPVFASLAGSAKGKRPFLPFYQPSYLQLSVTTLGSLNDSYLSLHRPSTQSCINPTLAPPLPFHLKALCGVNVHTTRHISYASWSNSPRRR